MLVVSKVVFFKVLELQSRTGLKVAFDLIFLYCTRASAKTCRTFQNIHFSRCTWKFGWSL